MFYHSIQTYHNTAQEVDIKTKVRDLTMVKTGLSRFLKYIK